MGYRIEYDRGNRTYEVRREHSLALPLFLATCFCFFLLAAGSIWPEGAGMIRSMLIPGDDAVTVQAFQIMTDDLRSGATVSDAVEAFCRYVIHGK